MQHSSLKTRVLRFGLFEADLRSGEVRKNGLKLKLQDQPFQILAMLLEAPGEVVTREQMRLRMWPADTFVDFDHGLNKAINKLREALGDSAARPRYIETLARRGYRLIAPVKDLSITAQPALPASPQKKRLLVLPFENLGPDAGEEYFSDGLTEEMISQLGQLSPVRLGVIARTSAMQYKHTSKQIAAIGEELNVDYVLEGSVRKSGTHARITAQLIEVRGQTHLWAASYDRELADLFAVQNEVVRRIARSLAVELLPERCVIPECARSLHPAAYEAYLRGRFAWAQRSESGLRSAIGYFEQALETDPEFAPAHVGIADAAMLLPWFGAVTPNEAAAKARSAANRALQIDPNLAEAHCSLALLRFWYDWDWESAEEQFQRAIHLNPNHGNFHHWYCAYLVSMGRFEEAANRQKLAEELDPVSLIIANAAGHVNFYSRHYDEAIEVFQKVIARDPAFLPAHFNLAQACLYTGRHAEAIASFELAFQWSGNPGASAALAAAHARAGNTDKARCILADLIRPSPQRYLSSPLVAVIYFALGEIDGGLDWLENGFNERSYWMTLLKVDPAYDSVRYHARFRRFLRLLNFETDVSCSVA